MSIYLIFPSAKQNWLDQFRRGLVPDHPLYGLNYLEDLGHHVFFSDKGHQNPGRFFPLRLLDHLSLTLTRVGFKVDVILCQILEILKADVIVTLSESVGLPTLLLKLVGIVKAPVIFCSIGFDRKFTDSQGLIRKIYELLLEKADRIVVYSQYEKDVFRQKFKLNPERVVRVSLGVDTHFLHPQKESEDIDVLVAGRNKGRDIKTLVEAVGKLGCKTFLICPKFLLKGITLPSNVGYLESVDYQTMRKIYARSKIVVLPLNSSRTSGQFGLLEAWAMGKAVVASNVPRLTTAFCASNGEHYILVKPQNIANLQLALRKLLNNLEKRKLLGSLGRQLVIQKYQSEHFADSLHRIIKDLKTNAGI